MIPSWHKQNFILVFLSSLIVLAGVVSEVKTIFAALFFPVILFAMIALKEIKLDMEIEYSLPSRAKVGDELNISVTVRCKKGMGLINLDMPSFREMEIVDGTNVHILYKGSKDVNKEYNYRVRAIRRGIFDYSDINIEYLPLFGRKNRKIITEHVNSSIVVLPPIKVLRKSQFQIKSKLITPRYAITRLGPITNEFEMIREFVPGDPFKTINWKSTAKLSNSGKIMVNQYEREGLKNFIFLLDTSSSMGRGVSYDNPMEYSISLILSGVNYLISKNYNVGFWPLTSVPIKQYDYVIPSSGGDTTNRIKEKLLRIDYRRFIQKAYLLDRTFTRIIMETKPQVTLVTSLSPRNTGQIKDVVRKLIRLGARVVVVDIKAESIVAKRIDPRIVGLFSKKIKGEKLMQGAVTWNPVTETLGKAAYEIAIRGGW